MDVKNAFLLGDLQEEVYMTQPQGYEDDAHPNFIYRFHKSLYGLNRHLEHDLTRLASILSPLDFICKLCKALYGLKHAAKAWSDKIG